ncbi:hypothetical protein CHS0354_030715 [Potamilus streckersoni]|uniref:Uncharacterized protein n=1 Tax=Potamilus streckersoni TaxID=2493646 RepID=A0AAE0SMR1_9BIVA|nr:hypothetical protein CHS0354_030715 [Potamilus streckersoni]
MAGSAMPPTDNYGVTTKRYKLSYIGHGVLNRFAISWLASDIAVADQTIFQGKTATRYLPKHLPMMASTSSEIFRGWVSESTIM